MFAFAIQNAVRIALLHVGVVVVGSLAAGLSARLCDSAGVPTGASTLFLKDYGVILMVLPLVWVFVALRVRNLPAAGESTTRFAIPSGMLLLVLLGVFVAYAVLHPLLSNWGFHLATTDPEG